jgi:hypothetical protein
MMNHVTIEAIEEQLSTSCTCVVTGLGNLTKKSKILETFPCQRLGHVFRGIFAPIRKL